MQPYVEGPFSSPRDKAYKKPKPRKETLLQRLTREASAANVEKWSKESRDWFSKKVKTLKNPVYTFQRIEREQTERGLSLDRAPGIGNLYTYHYQAKWDKQLPYWDMFPLIFLLNVYEDGHLGMNLHYIPPNLRLQLISRLLELRSSEAMTTRTKLMINYKILNAAAKYEAFKPCVKQYLTSQLRSKIIKIPAQEWEAAVFLPYAKFVRATPQQVYADSRNIIKGKK